MFCKDRMLGGVGVAAFACIVMGVWGIVHAQVATAPTSELVSLRQQLLVATAQTAACSKDLAQAKDALSQASLRQQCTALEQAMRADHPPAPGAIFDCQTFSFKPGPPEGDAVSKTPEP